MDHNAIFCALVLFGTASLTGGIALYAFRRADRPGARTFGWFMLALAEWSALYGVEIIVPTVPAKILILKWQYLGVAAIGPLWLAQSLKYNGRADLLKGRNYILLGIPIAIFFPLALTNEFHHLIFASISPDPERMPGFVIDRFGIGFWLNTAISYIFILLGIALYFFSFTKSTGVFRMQAGIMIAGSLIPLISNTLYLFGFFPLHRLDLTPFTFAITGIIMTIALFKFRWLDLIPIAAPIVIKNLRDAVIVVDRDNRLVDLNPIARQWLGIGDEAIGQNALDILKPLEIVNQFKEVIEAQTKIEIKESGKSRWFDLTISPLHDNRGRFLGRAILVHDITHEHNQLDREQRRAAQMRLLEEVGRQIANSLNEGEIVQYTVDALAEKFGFAEAAISMLVENEMELTVIAGTEDTGLTPGFRQKVGEGIVGHVAKFRNTYYTGDISNDPYYFHPSGKRTGSALGVPLQLEDQLLGVLYIESSSLNAINEDDAQTLQTLASHLVTAIQNARLFARIRDHLRAMTILQSVAQTFTSSLELSEIFQTVVQLLQDTFEYTYVSIYLLKGEVLRLGAQVGYPTDLIYYEIPSNAGVIGRTVKTKQPQFITDVNADPDFLRASYEVQTEICVPLLKDRLILGVLNVEADRARPLTENDLELLVTLAGPVAIAIDNAHLHSQVKSLALTDSLCNMPNRRAFDLAIRTEIDRAIRYSHDLALIILDIDLFKNYNDTWGHPVGDVRLKDLASLLRDSVRSPDFAARYGGEEFAIILPHTPKGSAIAIAERLRAAAEAAAPGEYTGGGPISGYTISLGVAAYPEDGDTPEMILQAADSAALEAKRLGKNRVCAAVASE